MKQYMNTKETATALGVSPRTLEKWRGNGTGPLFAKVGRRVLYDSADVYVWLKSKKRQRT